MKKIAIFCVNYNTYEELATYRKSVEASVKATKDVAVDMFIADNTEHDIITIDTIGNGINIKTFCFNKNLGYFGAIGKMMQNVDMDKYDYYIISNVDVLLKPDTLKCLEEYVLDGDTGWIAPQIYSELEKRDRNPNVVSRYSRKKLMALRLLYKHPLLNRLYTETLYRRKKIQKYNACQTYSGHGSFIILTNEYYNRCGIIDYPVFLYGEELYLGEQCRKAKLKVMYEPEIIISDKEHASTKKMSSVFYNHCNKEALDYILSHFY